MCVTPVCVKRLWWQEGVKVSRQERGAEGAGPGVAMSRDSQGCQEPESSTQGSEHSTQRTGGSRRGGWQEDQLLLKSQALYGVPGRRGGSESAYPIEATQGAQPCPLCSAGETTLGVS